FRSRPCSIDMAMAVQRLLNRKRRGQYGPPQSANGDRALIANHRQRKVDAYRSPAALPLARKNGAQIIGISSSIIRRDASLQPIDVDEPPCEKLRPPDKRSLGLSDPRIPSRTALRRTSSPVPPSSHALPHAVPHRAAIAPRRAVVERP